MNECFICVKVDREERPDVDALYMEAVQSMTGQGGWPLNIFLTPEQLPFYGGTYFPPDPRPGMPAFTQVLQAIAESWSERREEIRAGSERLRERLSGWRFCRPHPHPRGLARRRGGEVEGVLRRAPWRVSGVAPKFPQASVIEFLLLREREGRAGEDRDPPAHFRGRQKQAMALSTLRAMASGGICDQIGGGFHRYSVDARLDGAPLREDALRQRPAGALLPARLASLGRAPPARRVPGHARLGAARDARPQGRLLLRGLDADSEGEEGRFYAWTVAELRLLLGEDADAAVAWLGATEQGNFDGSRTIPDRA